MRAIPTRSHPPTLAAILLLLTFACADDGMHPDPLPAPGDTAFYPLDVGTTWTYDAQRMVRYIAEDGSDALPPVDQSATVVREIVADELIDGTVWALEEERFMLSGAPDTTYSWRRYRQDASGLYRADLPVRLPPGAAAGLDSVTAARRLAYPLSPGASWLLHDGNPAEDATVAFLDTLTTPGRTETAFAVVYQLEGDNPPDRRLFWYSERGLVASEVYREVVAIDAGTGKKIVIQNTETNALREATFPSIRPGYSQKPPGAAAGPKRAPLPSDGDRAGSHFTATPGAVAR
ncbi:MAG: hypothetical protein OEX18_07905 [Candidatus Krumholzibacteria bacterium]|nr:hypothetical protein [Candidatus Krumholzibacteria bacterium]MDH4337187.1 hypothetical protein [Candidatus Krumholzibacteria bacterium]MDH5269095.1 hypothetical protein [Candidatus Krumholzibacteria bacterium]